MILIFKKLEKNIFPKILGMREIRWGHVDSMVEPFICKQNVPGTNGLTLLVTFWHEKKDLAWFMYHLFVLLFCCFFSVSSLLVFCSKWPKPAVRDVSEVDLLSICFYRMLLTRELFCRLGLTRKWEQGERAWILGTSLRMKDWKACSYLMNHRRRSNRSLPMGNTSTSAHTLRRNTSYSIRHFTLQERWLPLFAKMFLICNWENSLLSCVWFW